MALAMIGKQGRENWGWIGVMWAAAALFFWPVLFGDQSLYFRDTLAVYYPQATYTKQALLSGELPLWENRIGFGYPYQSDPHSMVFYPLTPILLLLPFPLAYNVFTVVHVPLAGTFLFFQLRRWGISGLAACLGSFSLMFCGFTVSVTCLTTLLRGLTWAPLAMLTFDRYLGSGKARWIAATALVLAVEGSGTDPQYVLFSFILLALLPLIRPARGSVGIKGWFGGLAGAGLLANWVLAYQYLPLAQLFQFSSRTSGMAVNERTAYGVDPVNLYNTVLPTSFPDPATPDYMASFRAGLVPFYQDLYWGMPLLALACTSLAFMGWRTGQEKPGRKDEETDEPGLGRTGLVCLMLGGFTLLVALGDSTPVFNLLNRLVPPLKFFRYPGKYILMSSVAVALAVAIGTEGLLRGRRRSWFSFSRLLEGAILASIAGLAILSWKGPEIVRWFLDLNPVVVPLDLKDLFTRCQTTWSVNLTFLAVLLCLLRVLCYLMKKQHLSCRGATAAIAVLAAVDLLTTTHASFPTLEAEFLETAPQALRWVRPAGEGRPPTRYATYFLKNVNPDSDRTVLHQMMEERELMANFWGGVHGLCPVIPYMSVRLASEAGFSALFDGQSRRTRNRILAATGTPFVVRPPDPLGWDLESQIIGGLGKSVQVHLLRRPSPRAFIAHRAIPMNRDAKEPSLESVLALPETALFRPVNPEDRQERVPSSIVRCEILEQRRHRITLELDLKGHGLLVYLDTYYPGWTARVDGEERPILEVAGIFRGIEVREGDRRVEMAYEPEAFRLGSILSLMGLLVALGLLLRPVRERTVPFLAKPAGDSQKPGCE